MSDRRKPETNLSAAIQKTLTGLGYLVERIQAGRVRARGGYVYGASPGCPDLLLVGLGHLEVKRPGQELRETQVLWRKKAEAAGARVATVTSVREAIEVAGAWRSEK